MQKRDIIQDILSNIWLYEEIFGKLLDRLVFTKKTVNAKHVLENIYDIHDIDIFLDQIDHWRFENLTKIIHKYNSVPEEPSFLQKIFWKNDRQ